MQLNKIKMKIINATLIKKAIRKVQGRKGQRNHSRIIQMKSLNVFQLRGKMLFLKEF